MTRFKATENRDSLREKSEEKRWERDAEVMGETTLNLPHSLGVVGPRLTFPSLFKVLSGLRSKAAGTGLKGAAGAMETPGWVQGWTVLVASWEGHRRGNPGDPGEEADLLRPTLPVLGAGVRAEGAREGEAEGC